MGGRALRASLGEGLKPKPPVPVPGPALTHSPVKFIVVIVDFPPEVEPGECEAEGDCEEQEPQAFPLEEQSKKGVKWGQGPALQAASHLNEPLSPLL